MRTFPTKHMLSAATPLRPAPPHWLTDEEVAQLAHDCEQDPFGAADPQPLAVAWRHIRCLVDEVIATRKGYGR